MSILTNSTRSVFIITAKVFSTLVLLLLLIQSFWSYFLLSKIGSTILPSSQPAPIPNADTNKKSSNPNFTLHEIHPCNITISKPDLFIMASPKSGSSSLVKWLSTTNQIHSTSKNKVENNELWSPIDKLIERNNQTGFELSDISICKLNDAKYIQGFNAISYNELTFEKSVFYLHIPYMSRLFGMRYPTTKILITIRNYMHRLKSNYLFFIGDERRLLPNKYGDINSYLRYILDELSLKDSFGKIKSKMQDLSSVAHSDGDINIFNDVRWIDILKDYKNYLINVMVICKRDFKSMGNDYATNSDKICTERDLIRNAIGSSCYILPIMHWFLNNQNPSKNLRILQSEMMFKYPDEHITNILCWMRNQHNNKDECEWRNNHNWNIPNEKLRESNKAATNEIDDDLEKRIQNELNVCDYLLEKFITVYPHLQLFPFDLSIWK